MIKGDILDLEEFTGQKFEHNLVDKNLPLEAQGLIDSLTALQFIIFLEKKYSLRLTRTQISTITVYQDLIDLFN